MSWCSTGSMPSTCAPSWCPSSASQCSDAEAADRCREAQTLEGQCAPVRKRKTAKRAAHPQNSADSESGFEFCRWAQEKLAGDAAERQDLLDALAGHVVTMAFHPWGCRVIQCALDAGDDKARVLLAEELRGHARDACFSLHANFVLSKIIEVVPLTASQWVFEELQDSGVQVARDNCGCRVLSRLFARSDIWQDPGSTAEGLIGSVLGNAAELCYHPFGQHVIEAAFINGADRHRSRIFAALRGKCARMSKNRHASYMVQRALLVCGPSERMAIAEEILGKHKTLMVLCQDQFGHHVVRTALGRPGYLASQAAWHITTARDRLCESKFGSRLLSEADSVLPPC